MKRLNGTKWAMTLALGSLIFCSGAWAESPAYPDQRWMIGVDTIANTLGENNDQDNVHIDEEGTGGGFQVGYLLSPRFQLRLYTSAADHGTNFTETELRLTGGSLEVAYLFRTDTNFRPYLSGGVGGFKLESRQGDLSYEADGGGMSFGAGAHWHLGKVVAIHFSGRLEAINWDSQRAILELPSGDEITVEGPIDESGGVAKFTLGLAFWL